MSYKQTLSTSSFGLQPAPAWLAILGFVLFSALCILAGATSILRFTFPLGAFAVAAFLYFRYPILYISFTWWIWFLSPMVARMVDFYSGWDPQRLMLLTPFLVTLLTLCTLVRRLPSAYRQGGLPFILALTAVFYGFLVGLIKNAPLAVFRVMLDWLTPLLFSFHLFMHWRDYPKLSQNIQRTFLWGVLVTGVYGVVQYLIAPAWDGNWITQTEMITSGVPEPLGIRVFSTMHSHLPFAIAMMAGLVLLFSDRGPLRIPASIAGYLSFLLSAVRTAWGGWVVALLILLTSMKARLQRRLIVTILVMAVCIIPLATIEPFSEVISKRLESFSNIQNDSSANARADTYNQKLSAALSDLIGKGMGGTLAISQGGALKAVTIDDSGILDTFFTLGWLGALPYLGGIILIVFTLVQTPEMSADSFANAARAISISVIAQLSLGSTMVSLPGLILWSFASMGLAARNYYKRQRAIAFTK